MNSNNLSNPVIAPQLRDRLVVAMSINQRVWRIVKDKPESTSFSVASTLREDRAKVSIALSKMWTRGMLTRKEQQQRGRRTTYAYSVPSKFAVYELLPLPAFKVPSKSAASTPPAPWEPPVGLMAGAAEDSENLPEKVKDLIDNLKVLEALELLLALDDLQHKLKDLSDLEVKQLHKALRKLFKSDPNDQPTKERKVKK